MKTLLILALSLTLSPAFAADCPKNSDACSGGAKSSSPFLAASLAADRVIADANKAAPGKAAAPAAKASRPAPAQPAAVSSAAAPSVPAKADKGSSSPAWLLFIGAGLAGLYFYLSGGIKKGKRK